MKKYIRSELILMLLLLLLTCSARAAAARTFSIANPSGPADCLVYSWNVNNKYTIAIPGSWDATRLIFSFDGDQPVIIGETEARPGDFLDVTPFLGQEVQLKDASGRRLGTILFQQGSSLVCIFIQTDAEELARAMKDKNRVITDGSVLVTESDGTVVWNGPFSQFKGRGNNTFSNQNKKKPFQIKLPEKINISGMGRSKTWLMIANHVDLSLLRNQISLDLALEAGLRFGVESVQADCWFNGVYNGLYLLTEKIQINKSRINITNLEEKTEALNPQDVSTYPTFREKKGYLEIRGYEIPNDPEDITGGFIIELEKPYRFATYSKNGFRYTEQLNFVIKEPTYASRAQAAYVSGLFEKLIRALKAGNGYDPVTGIFYADLIDMPSFALKYLMEELTRNNDALASSQFFYKDSDSIDPKIYAGPCWDYDLSMGTMSATGVSPKSSFLEKVGSLDNNLYRLLWLHEDFRMEVCRVYRERFRPALSILLGETDSPGKVLLSLDGYRETIAESAIMNFTRWNPANIHGYNPSTGKTNAQSTDWIQNWLRQRVEYMDASYGQNAAAR